MERWRVEDLMDLAGAVYKAGLSSFVVRRAVQRLERGEISVAQAVSLIRRGVGHCHPEARCVFGKLGFSDW